MTTTSDLLALEKGTTTAEALAYFDRLAPVRAEDLSGRWHGGEVPTGHSMDGILTVSGWYGKQFDDVEHVHPLLFRDAGGDVFAVDPLLAPTGLAGRLGSVTDSPILRKSSPAALSALKPLIRTGKHRARLRNIEYRGVVSAAMVYDHKAIIDHFRKVDDSTLLGVMDLRDVDQPYFFTLRRD